MFGKEVEIYISTSFLVLNFQSKYNTIFKVKAMMFFNVNATEVYVKVVATPCCI